MLRDAELGTRLTSDYSTMYQLCVLDKQMSARLTDEKQRLEKLKSVVANAPEISRNFFASETKKEKAKSQRLSQKRSKASSLDSKIVADLDSDAALTTLAGVIDSEEKFDLVLMTPTRRCFVNSLRTMPRTSLRRAFRSIPPSLTKVRRRPSLSCRHHGCQSSSTVSFPSVGLIASRRTSFCSRSRAARTSPMIS